MILTDVWGSVVKMIQEIIVEAKSANPAATIDFIDWEAHANIQELPNADLIGPTALTIEDHGQGMYQVTFAVAASSFGDDANLFRHRDYIARIFERMKAEMKMKLYDAASAAEKGMFVFTEGTTVVPMSRADARPWQYVQGVALLLPASTS